MDRIAIIGCGGSGKSYLARALGAALGITPVHLDTLYYDRAWNPLPAEQFAAVQHGLVAAPRWIIDGNYAATLPIRLRAADIVIFLDLPARACLRGIAARRIRHGGGQHDAIGVYDRITWEFIRYIWGYRRKMAPRVRRLIAEHASHADVVVLRSRRAARRYHASIAATHLISALARELAEELHLNLADATPPQLCWIQDQMVTRPGPTPPPRKLHLIFRCFITSGTRAALAAVEYDQLPDGSHEPDIIEWINYRKAASIPLFPLIGQALARLPHADAPITDPLLPPITDTNYTWM